MAVAAATPARGPVGNTRSIPLSILWAILTLGIYTFIWVYRTQEETKRYSGNGIGGILGIVIWALTRHRHLLRRAVGGSLPARGPRRRGARLRTGAGNHGPLGAAPDHRAVRLVHQGAGRAEPVLGVQGSTAGLRRFLGCRGPWAFPAPTKEPR